MAREKRSKPSASQTSSPSSQNPTSSPASRKRVKLQQELKLLDPIQWPKETAVLIYGSGECAQLGMGEDVTSLLKPKIHKALQEIVKISAGGLHTLALSRNGHIFSWGCNDEKALGHAAEEFQVGCVDAKLENPPFFVDIACGDSISAGISREGKLFAWGTFRDSRGVMGFDGETEICSIPSPVKALNKISFAKIFSGANHLIGIAQNGESWAWGCGEQGQLGRCVSERHRMLALKPASLKPPGRKASKFCKFALGAYHSLGITQEGQVYAWGLNNHGQLGLGDLESRFTPELIEKSAFGGENVIDVAAGEHHSLVLTASGKVWSFGRGDSGQLGVASAGEEIENSSTPLLVSCLERIVSIAAGSNHCIAVDSEGCVWTWGYGDMGQLGLGREDNEAVPVKMANLPGKVLQATAGGHHTLLLIEKPASK